MQGPQCSVNRIVTVHLKVHDNTTFRLGMVSGDLVNFDLISGGTGEPDRD